MVVGRREKKEKEKIIKELIFVFVLCISVQQREVNQKKYFIFITSSIYAYCTAPYIHFLSPSNSARRRKREAD